MKKVLAGLMMVLAFGSAAAQSTQRGVSDDKDHPVCEGQHDCRKAAAKGANNGKGAKAAKRAGVSDRRARAAGVGIAAGVAAVALASATNGGGHHNTRRPTPSSP